MFLVEIGIFYNSLYLLGSIWILIAHATKLHLSMRVRLSMTGAHTRTRYLGTVLAPFPIRLGISRLTFE